MLFLISLKRWDNCTAFGVANSCRRSYQKGYQGFDFDVEFKLH